MAVRMGTEKSNFSLTCSLLSQYLKEKGSFADLGLGINRPSESKAKQGTPTTMNLLSGLESYGSEATKTGAAANAGDNSPRAAQMTIFYGGSVMVFDNFPADMAKELFAMVGRVCPAAGNPVPPRGAAALTSTSDLPIARRASLNRFLEKRKDRISSRAPYQLQAPADAVPNPPSSELKKAKEKRKPWLGLAPSKLGETL